MTRNRKKTQTGFVVSNKMKKTGVVLVERMIQHPLYKRIVKVSKKYKFHDEQNQCSIGDQVKIIESKPLSKDKKWRLFEITRKAL